MKLSSLLLLVLCGFSRHENGGDILKKMHDRYAGKWYKTFSFSQTTEQYRKDSLLRTSTWYESIVFPDKFRIDFGNKEDSNAVIYLRDSIFSFHKGILMRRGLNDENLTFLLGGMYSYPLEEVKTKIKQDGYNINKSHESFFKGQPVYVIGAGNDSEKVNQLWIDKEKLVLLRFIKFNKDEKEEGVFLDHKRFGNAWSETACDFYINDKLIQRERYHNCQADVKIDERIFDPTTFIGRQ